MDWLLFKKTLAQKQAAAEQRAEQCASELERAEKEGVRATEALTAKALESTRLFKQSGSPEQARAARDAETTRSDVSTWHSENIANLRCAFEQARDESDRLRAELYLQNMRDAVIASREAGQRGLAQCRSGFAELARCAEILATDLQEARNLLRIEGESAYSAPINTYAQNVLAETDDAFIAHRARDVLNACEGIPFRANKLGALTDLLRLQFPLFSEPLDATTLSLLELLVSQSKEAVSNAHARKGFATLAAQAHGSASHEPTEARAMRLAKD